MNDTLSLYKTIFDKAHIGILATDATGNVAYANARAEILLGSRTNLIGKALRDVHAAVAEKVADCLANRKNQAFTTSEIPKQA